MRKAINPPISGQYMGRKDTSGRSMRTLSLSVQRDLLARSGKRPGDLERSLLAKDEPELAGRFETLGTGGAEARARFAIAYRAQKILMEEAVIAACFVCAHASVRHARPALSFDPFTASDETTIKANFAHPVQPRFPENATTLTRLRILQIAGTSVGR